MKFLKAWIMASTAIVLSQAVQAQTQSYLPTADLAAQINSPGRINTAGWADSPFMTADGKALYFMYTPYNLMPFFFGQMPAKSGPDRPGHHPGANFWGDSDIYKSTRNADGTWSQPVNMSFNDSFADSSGMISNDGTEFYFIKDVSGQSDIYVSTLNTRTKVWGKPAILSANINDPKANEDNPHISADRLTLIFSSNRAGGYGNKDLYVSVRSRSSGSWGKAVNMGPNFNTDKMEDQAFLTLDGKMLYFNRESTIMVSTRQPSGNWSAPKPVEFDGGAPPFVAEASLTSDGKRMMMVVSDVDRKLAIIKESTLLPSGKWSTPKPLD